MKYKNKKAKCYICGKKVLHKTYYNKWISHKYKRFCPKCWKRIKPLLVEMEQNTDYRIKQIIVHAEKMLIVKKKGR